MSPLSHLLKQLQRLREILRQVRCCLDRDSKFWWGKEDPKGGRRNLGYPAIDKEPPTRGSSHFPEGTRESKIELKEQVTTM